ncbi:MULTISPECIES: right-handed parallel beta-helix repeat-containing protein [unclassified Streptomyces]|uniref:right-handed parallel beta-helix repeat-containing protein n=1 Tax=unclassified Streptomyces TaxID=2593676 RepID=UPI002E291F31|nr:right-handed parallel beta-helix repeat-containing protein [Streptomyces sp. NBC_00208]WSF87687.1 right-handed parallel beta-helix repeat-containing protein [Streptomyces sp. NBC_01744]
MSWTRRLLVVLVALAAALLAAPAAQAHEERPVTLPDGSGSVPVHRAGEPDLLVCKSDRADFERRISGFPAKLRARNLELFERCRKSGYRHLQQAVDKVGRPGMNIAILPGLYEEEPSLPGPTGECARLKAPNSQLGYQILSYAQQKQCPHNQNLVAILGKKQLQIEGTGAERTDVVIDAKYQKLNAIRADGSDGIYFKNFTAQRTTFNSLYVLAQDGFVIDDVLTRWNDEYGFLTFASDHGLYKNCESYGNGDSGIYPGSASDINDGYGYDVPRYSIEITGCRSHHNMVGYSGTAGDSVYVHDNEFDHNMGGASMDSAFPGHPGLPQNHARFERNLIHDNNADYYPYVADGTCAKPPVERGYEGGVVCPQISMPPGTGIITAGGNWNIYENNWIYGQQRAAFFLSAVPAFIRGENALAKQIDTSHHNRYAGNHLGTDKAGRSRPNRTDVWWDGQGDGNCWQSDTGPSTPRSLPECGAARGAVSGRTDRLVGDPVKLAQLLVCADYNVQARRLPAGCDWYGARGIERIEVQIALGVALVLVLVGGVLWWRRLRHSRLATAATLLGAIGLGLDVAGATTGLASSCLPTVALLLTGAWWTGIGFVLRGERPGLGWTTTVLGVLTLLDAFDKGVLMIPWIPIGPAWVRGLLGVIWVVWAVVAAARHGERAVRRRADPGPGADADADAADRHGGDGTGAGAHAGSESADSGPDTHSGSDRSAAPDRDRS